MTPLERPHSDSLPAGIPAATPPWLHGLLLDEAVTDLCVNGPNEVWVDRGTGMEPHFAPPEWSESALQEWVFSLLSMLGKSWDARHPFVDATAPSGHRYHFAFPPACPTGITVSIRRLSGCRRNDPTRLPASRWAPETGRDTEAGRGFTILTEAVARGEPILIAGSTGSGKTTLLNDLLSFVPANERILALEDTPELAPAHPHFLGLLGRPANADGFGELSLRTLLRQSLRMRPDRIVLGECRGSEVLELLQTLNTGHRGALATLHANGPRDALRRLELLCLLASGGSIPLGAIRELLAHGLEWIVQVGRTPAGRRITELCRVEGREGDTILLRPMINPTQWNPSPPSPPRNQDLLPQRTRAQGT